MVTRVALYSVFGIWVFDGAIMPKGAHLGKLGRWFRAEKNAARCPFSLSEELEILTGFRAAQHQLGRGVKERGGTRPRPKLQERTRRHGKPRFKRNAQLNYGKNENGRRIKTINPPLQNQKNAQQPSRAQFDPHAYEHERHKSSRGRAHRSTAMGEQSQQSDQVGSWGAPPTRQ